MRNWATVKWCAESEDVFTLTLQAENLCKETQWVSDGIFPQAHSGVFFSRGRQNPSPVIPRQGLSCHRCYCPNCEMMSLNSREKTFLHIFNPLSQGSACGRPSYLVAKVLAVLHSEINLDLTISWHLCDNLDPLSCCCRKFGNPEVTMETLKTNSKWDEVWILGWSQSLLKIHLKGFTLSAPHMNIPCTRVI